MNNNKNYRITAANHVPNDTDLSQIQSWTDDVKWPESLIKSYNPQTILEQAKHPTEIDVVHNMGFTGKGINIAIIDQRLYTDHPEYRDRIKHYEMVGNWTSTTPDYHGSLVTGCAVGKTTGTAPDAGVYYFAANNWPPIGKFKSAIAKLFGKETLESGHRAFYNMAIRRILEINKTLPEHDKIRFLSCSWGSNKDQLRAECDQLFDECEKNGIMVIGGFYKPERNKSRPCDKSGRTMATNGQDITERYNKDSVGIPTDCKTTPFFQGGYIYKKYGGSSSTFPYLAGVFACACQGNEIFFTRPNWQNELFTLLQKTATTTNDGKKIINPVGIRERVTQIAHEMEITLIKNKRLQNE